MPITGGGGAAAVTVDIVNAMWDNAQQKSDSGDARISQAISLADPAPSLTPVDVDMTYAPPPPPTLPEDDPNGGQASYDVNLANLMQLITSNFRSFISEYFPDPGYYEDALAWCGRAIADGGSGINT